MSETAAARRATFAAKTSRSRAAPSPLAVLILAAVAIRLLTALLLPNVVYPDETFQLIEQADRLVTGHGLVPWEFAVGARSWLLPGLLVPLMAAGRALSPDPRLAIGFITAAMTALSATSVWSAYVLGRGAGDRLHGLFAAGLVGFWAELVYFSPHVLADTVSGALLLGGLAACAAPERPRRLFWGGLLLGAAFVVRIQLAPAIGLAGLMICGPHPRRYLQAGAGFVLPVLALGAVDWLTWGAPFSSVLVYLKLNSSGVADVFGRSPPQFFIGYEGLIWRLAMPLVLLSAYVGGKRTPTAAVATLAILLTFSLVGHKEPRFIYPALLPLFVLCGVGSAEIVRWARARIADARLRRAAPLAMAGVWAVASTAAAVSPVMRANWSRDTAVLRAFDAVNADPQACGLALAPAVWLRAGASRLRTDVPLYPGFAPSSAYNRLLSFDGPLPPQDPRPGFTLQACYGPDGGCLYSRPGRCAAGVPTLRADPEPKVTKIMETLGYRPRP